MLRAVLRLLIPCLSLVLSLTALTHQAGACSGGGAVIELVPVVLEAEFIVDGHVKWVDETGFNGIITVRRYLNGKGGPDEIIVSTMPASEVMYWQERSVSSPCNFGPRMRPMITGSRVIMFLQRSPDGTYQLAYRHIFSENRFAQFSESGSKIGIGYSLSDAWGYQLYQLSWGELVELIQSVPGMTTVGPTPSVAPLHAPLLVTTASGRHFRIPVDGAPAHEIGLYGVFRRNLTCWSDSCTAWSPEGVDRQMIGERTQVVDNVITVYPSTHAAIAYSPLGDAYAAWDEADDGVMLTVGVLPVITAVSNFNADTPYQSPATMRLGMNAPLATFSDLGVWSPDGRILAFVDANGLWFWDVFTPEAPPELSDYRDVTAVHGYSWTGRYLSVTDADGKHYIDLVTGENFPDGAWGPDDRALLVYGSNSNIIYTVPHRELLPFLPKNVEVCYAEWTRCWGFVALACDDRGTCGVTEMAIQRGYHSYEPLPYIGYAFDYSADTQNLAVVKDGYTLTIRDAAAQQHREINLDGQLDAEIISVEWLPSVFYDARYDGTAW